MHFIYVRGHVCNAIPKGCLGEWAAFNEHYSRPIKRGQTKTADRDAVKLGRKRSAELVQALLPLMLRRTKQEKLAKELPDKVDRIVFCALTPLQVGGFVLNVRTSSAVEEENRLIYRMNNKFNSMVIY